MRVSTLCLALLAFLFTACAKNDPQPEVTKAVAVVEPPQLPLKAPFLPCHCAPDSTEFIRGVFNGARICFSMPSAPSSVFWNCNFLRPGIQDQINMIRPNERNGLRCEFYFTNTSVFKRRLPYVMPHSNLAYCENIQIAVMDRAQPWVNNTICYGCPDDDYNYFGMTSHATDPNGLFVTVTDTTGGFLKGSFRGRAFTKTGKQLDVTDGTFNVRIHKLTTW